MKLPFRFKFSWRMTRFFWRGNLITAMAVAAITAVIVGVLVVGDSVRWSLKNLVENRLGRIESCLRSNTFFRMELADEIEVGQKRVNQKQHRNLPDPVVVPAIRLNATLLSATVSTEAVNTEKGGVKQSQKIEPITLWGINDRFAKLESGNKTAFPVPSENSVTINQSTANKFGLKPGDQVLIRLINPQDIPAETIFGNKDNVFKSFPVTIYAVTEDDSLAGLSFNPQQRASLNVFANLNWLQNKIGQQNRANVILSDTAISYNYRPVLDDFGFQLQVSELGFWNVYSRKIFFGEQERQALIKRITDLYPSRRKIECNNTLISVIDKVQVLRTFQRKGKRQSLPYSFLAATDDPHIPHIKPGLVAITAWTAKQLDISEGEELSFDYYQPDSLDGKMIKKTHKFMVCRVLPEESIYSDKSWVPPIAGISDKSNLMDWNVSFPFDAQNVTVADEKYWQDFGCAPKFYINLEEARKIFGNRIGNITSIRVWDLSIPQSSDLAPPAQEVGWSFVPIRANVARAAGGTVSFELLFAGLSIFIILAAVIFLVQAIRLNMDNRVASIGILQAIGWDAAVVRRIYLYELSIICVFAAALGVGAGIGYADLILWALKTQWIGLISVPFVQIYIQPISLVLGAIIGFSIAWLAVIFTLTKMTSIRSVLRLKGITEYVPDVFFNSKYLLRCRICTAMYFCLLTGLVICSLWFVSGNQTNPTENVWGVLGVSFIALICGIAGYGYSLKTGIRSIRRIRAGLYNHLRRPRRSTVVMGLVSLSVYVILSADGFVMDSRLYKPYLLKTNGNYSLFVQTATPVYANLNYPQQRKSLGFTEQDEQLFSNVQIDQAIVHDGDKASSINMYIPKYPRVIGIGMDMMENPRFQWNRSMYPSFPWVALWKPEFSYPLVQQENIQQEFSTEDPDVIAIKTRQAMLSRVLPFVTDQYTLSEILNLKGVNSRILLDDHPGREVQGRVVGILSSGLFQGELLASEDNLRFFYPEIHGYEMFFVSCPSEIIQSVKQTLLNRLNEYGVEIETIEQRSNRLFTVYNTYIHVFQSLSLIGLLIGLLSLPVFLLRTIRQRQSELAFLFVMGYSDSRIRGILVWEQLQPVIIGLFNGIISALITVGVVNKISSAAPVFQLSFFPLMDTAVTAGLSLFVAWFACRLAASFSRSIINLNRF